jgi:hypothetical protein
MNGTPALQRQASDYYMNAMNGGMAAVPPHLRSGIQASPRSQSPAQYPLPTNGQQQRPSLTSNPSSGYNPPQILEPTPNNGQQQTNSGGNSPHISNAMAGWQSPHGLPGNQQNDYAYPDPNNNYNVGAAQMYTYQQQGVPRPHSTGPMDYTQMRGQEMWAQHQQ